MAETNEIEITETVQKYLDPVPGDSPAGIDAANTEEYFKLNMEIQKVLPDYKKCIELSETILTEKSKDIKIASWLCFSLFRTDKLQGLKEGLLLIYHLLIKYGNNLFPSNTLHRSKAIQFLNSARFVKLLEKEEVDRSNAAEIAESEKVFSDIIAECERLFPESIPDLKLFNETLGSMVQKAAAFTSVPVAPAVSQKTAITPSVRTEETIKEEKPSTLEVKEIKITGEKDAINQIRQLLTMFYEEQQDGTKKEKIPSAHFVFGIARHIQWARLFRPADIGKVTQVSAPNPIIQGKIREWFASGNWDMLIPRIEINFLKADSEFYFWLDAQRYVIKALEQKGGNYILAAEDIKYHLSKLIARIPDLPQLKFKDKQTPFADEETSKWLNEEVKQAGEKKTADTLILPALKSEEYSDISKEYEEACAGLPSNFEDMLLSMQKKIEADQRIKGRFLRRLNLANFCMLNKNYELAKVHLGVLKQTIEKLNLTVWEPALCTAVWESLYMVNSKLLNNQKEGQSASEYETEQKQLFSWIARYDSLLALKISKINQ